MSRRDLPEFEGQVDAENVMVSAYFEDASLSVSAPVYPSDADRPLREKRIWGS